MSLPVLVTWVRTPLHALAVLAVLAAVLAYAVRAVRKAAAATPAAVVVPAFGAMLCTAYSADTSWNFARDHLAMHGTGERTIMFAAAEVALFAVALGARQNLRTSGAPGTPGVLVWVITGVQAIPAYSESGVIAGTVRAFVGPVLAALLWHLAMGIELRHAKPDAASQGLLAVLARELRERLLSWLGLSVRGRDAAQITRDRWTRIATRRAARLADLQTAGARPWRLARARRRLAVAVDRTDAGVLAEQRAVLLDRLAAYRGAAALASMDLTAPWTVVAQTATTAAPEVEPVPVPETTEDAPSEPPRPVPEVVPAGVRLLPLVALPRPVLNGTPRAAVPAIEYAAVGGGYAGVTVASPWPEADPWALPDDALPPELAEPEDDSPPPPAEDTLTAKTRRDYIADLTEHIVPSIRTLKDRYGVGQARATRIQAELKKGLS